jgi:hypothetical protein
MGFNDLNKPKKTLGADNVQIAGPNSTFGEVLTAQLTPVAQGDFVFNINNQTFNTSEFAGGTVTAVDGQCELDSGTSASGSATVQLRRGLKYRAGQGSAMKATALFSEPDAGNAQFVGAGSSECGYYIGYFGTNFGILHSISGSREIRRLDITTGAGTEDVTVTLNGYSKVVSVTGASSPEQTAYQLALADYGDLGTGGWLADAQSGSVYFISARSSADLTNSYSVSSGGSIAGTFTRVVEGEAQSNDFIPSASFNVDKMDGTGPTGMTLNPQNGNVYQIAFQYLGYGNADFFIENPDTGHPAMVHRIKNANNRTTPVLKNPNLNVLATSANIGGTTTKKLKTVSMGAYIEGNIVPLDPKFSKSFTFASVDTSNVYRPLAAFKANRVFNDQSCFGEFDFLEVRGANLAGAASPKTLTVAFFLNAEITGEVNFQYVDEENSIVSYAALNPGTGGNTLVNVANLTPLYEFVVGAGAGVTRNIADLSFVFGIGNVVTMAIRTSAGLAGQAGITWFEQQ